MGGSGSNRWREHQGRLVAEETLVIRLDGPLRQLLKQAMAAIPSTRTSTVVWHRGERQVGTCTIMMACRADGDLRMHVAMRNDQESSATTVTFALMPKPLGGHCAFWRCPGCQRRCGVLYFFATVWRCRICVDITYTSSNKSDKRVSQLLASSNLAAELGQLQAGLSISELERAWKAYELIQQRANRAIRRRYKRHRPSAKTRHTHRLGEH
jgi:hypothetical protein